MTLLSHARQGECSANTYAVVMAPTIDIPRGTPMDNARLSPAPILGGTWGKMDTLHSSHTLSLSFYARTKANNEVQGICEIDVAL